MRHTPLDMKEHGSPIVYQKGSVLFVGLVILAVITIAALSMMNVAVQDERITANMRMRTQLLLTAEAGLYEANKELLSQYDAGNKECGSLKTFIKNQFADVQYDGVAGGSSYTVSAECNSDGDELVLTSYAALPNGAEKVLIGTFQAPVAAFDPPSPPAAVSCFRGICNVPVGAGNKYSGIYGQDHDVPEAGCSGRACWLDPNGSGILMPAVYMEKPGGQLSVQGGNADFCGADFNDPDTVVCATSGNGNGNGNGNGSSNLNDFESNWNPDRYPDDEDYNSTPPASSDYFDESGWGEVESQYDEQGGILVIDGENYSRSGTGHFAGVLIIKNCGTYRSRGNFSIYGAIIVDATYVDETTGERQECGEDYFPLDPGGTPGVRFSNSAIENAKGGLPATPGGIKSWRELPDW